MLSFTCVNFNSEAALCDFYTVKLHILNHVDAIRSFLVDRKVNCCQMLLLLAKTRPGAWTVVPEQEQPGNR